MKSCIQSRKKKTYCNAEEPDAALVVNKETHKIDFEFAKREVVQQAATTQEPAPPLRNGYYPDDVKFEYYEPVIPEEMK